jgi:hypothetical protein
MHRTLINTICPSHQKVRYAHNDATFDWGRRDPVAVWGKDLKARIVVLEECEAFIVCVCAETDFFVFVEFGEKLWVGRGRVAD